MLKIKLDDLNKINEFIRDKFNNDILKFLNDFCKISESNILFYDEEFDILNTLKINEVINILNNDYELELSPLEKLKDLIEKTKNEIDSLDMYNYMTNKYAYKKQYLNGLIEAYELIKN